jgi:hypothetical protein
MRTVRISLIISAVGTIAGLGLVVYLMFWGPDHLDIAGKSLPQLLEDEEVLVPLIVIPVMLIISAVVTLPFLRMAFPSEIKNGITAQAKVLKVWDTGVSINDNPQVGLQLEISPPSGRPFQAEAKTVVSRLNVALVQPGVGAEVKYDPQKPQRLQVLTLDVSGAASNRAATRLEELSELRDKRLITEVEYNQKREEILKEL